MGFVNVSECLAIRAETVSIKKLELHGSPPTLLCTFVPRFISMSKDASENIHFKCVGIVSCPFSRIITMLGCIGQAANGCTKMQI